MINEEKHDDGHLDEKAGKNTDISEFCRNL